MALDKVTQEILKDADDKAAAIRAEATVEIDKIKADADARIAEMKEKEDKRLKDEIALLERQEVSSSELESKKIVLAKKKEVLAKAFDQAHALKGVTGNLALTPIDKPVREITEFLRSRTEMDYQPLLTEILAQRDALRDLCR